METLSYRTRSVKKEEVRKEWYIIDAENEVLGRLASRIAIVLRGKHKPTFTPHIDTGDNVIVINAEKVRMTGKKMMDKEYMTFSGYPGGQKVITAEKLMQKNPVKIVEHAVKGMLPKNKLGNAIFKNLYVYTGKEHKHQAQQPKEINIKSIK